MFEIRDWLPGSPWVVIAINTRGGEAPISETCAVECELMRGEGKRLFDLGLLPEFAGTIAPAAFQGGTGGNFAVRKPDSDKWVVTAKGAHKGHLRETDFVEVVCVNWATRKIFIRRDGETTLPSTDSLLVAMVFEKNREINSWAHFHAAVATEYSVHLPYPSFEPGDRENLSGLISRGARAINMIDHNILKTPNGLADSAIVVGENAKDAFTLAKKLITEKTK